MDFLIADTSTYSPARLSSDEQKSVKMTREALLWLLPAKSGHSRRATTSKAIATDPPGRMWRQHGRLG